MPQNTSEFSQLLKRGTHPCTQKFNEQFPLRDVSAARNLKRIVSCLAHWSNIFGHCDFIPNFVFPFLKVFENDTLMCFETIATIILNQCQLWFEFAPLEPINYLGLVENILDHFEPVLMRFYKDNEITTTVYAWSLLPSAFTEVLDQRQWLQLWDHIISNPPYFLLFCVVAYNIQLKSVIMSLDTHDAVNQFFEDQNIVDVNKVISLAYKLSEECPAKLHPSNYITEFISLHSDHYQKFVNFPKILIGKKVKESNTLQQETRLLNQKMYELEKIEKNLANQVEDEIRETEHNRRLQEVQKIYEEAIFREEDRVAYQKKHLLMYQKQLRDKERRLMEMAKQSASEKSVKRREHELEELLHDFQRDVSKKIGVCKLLLFFTFNINVTNHLSSTYVR